MSEEGTLLKITIQLFSFKDMHNLIEMTLMCLLVLGINQNIIKVNHHEIANVRFEYLIH